MNKLVKLRDKWFPKPKPLSALDAYTITKYGLNLIEIPYIRSV